MIVSIDGWVIDVAARQAVRGNKTRQLSPRAIRLLQVFAEAGGSVLSRAHLLD